MKRYAGKLTEKAFEDLRDIRDWIVRRADVGTASAFVERIERKISGLSDFPERGTLHPEIRADLRSLSFERRYLIFYHVDGKVVRIDRVLSVKRDLAAFN